ncbi:MAG: tetratricopeptide repeat protein [Sandaracinaceae bacterium]
MRPRLLRLLRLRSIQIAFGVALVVGLGLCLSPVLGIPGIEAALVLGVLLPPFAGLLGARQVVWTRGEEAPAGAATYLGRAATLGLALVGLPTALLLLNLLRFPACSAAEGLAFLALGPAVGCLHGAVLGTTLALLGGRGRVASTLAMLAPLLAALVALYRFWATPAIDAYGHFFGELPGTLYDPDIRIEPTYLSFRLLTAVWLLALSALVAALLDPESGRLRWARARQHPGWSAVAVALLAATVAGDLLGTQLGHRASVASLKEALGGRVAGERCIAIVPGELPRTEAERLAEDCDFRVAQAEAALGVRQPRLVTAFFFRSADEKRALMGASGTYVAKPWRHEVYLQVDRWPHPVLFHEIVHVVAGNVGRGPFRVAGPLGGWIPSPTLIEGTAVAIAWDAREGLTPHQWARAMVELDRAPPLEDLLGLRFLLQPASRAYVLSGSFLRWVLETQGPSTVRRLYASADWAGALGEPLADAEARWRAFLREEVELPPEARALAELRFSQPGLLGQVCPHRVANLRREAAAQVSAGDDRAAIGTCRAILDVDAAQARTRASLVGALARLGRTDEARQQLQVLEERAPAPVVHRARLTLADAAWRRGDRDRAREVYRALLEEPQTDDAARQVEVRLLGLEMTGVGERALRGLLAPRADRRSDAGTALFQAALIDRVRADGLAAYLAGRQMLFRQRFDLAFAELTRAEGLGLPTERLRRELHRMLAISAFGVGRNGEAALRWRAVRDAPGSTMGQRVEAADWLERLARMRARER